MLKWNQKFIAYSHGPASLFYLNSSFSLCSCCNNRWAGLSFSGKRIILYDWSHKQPGSGDGIFCCLVKNFTKIEYLTAEYREEGAKYRWVKICNSDLINYTHHYNWILIFLCGPLRKTLRFSAVKKLYTFFARLATFIRESISLLGSVL